MENLQIRGGFASKAVDDTYNGCTVNSGNCVEQCDCEIHETETCGSINMVEMCQTHIVADCGTYASEGCHA